MQTQHTLPGHAAFRGRHFELRTVPAGMWERMKSQTPDGFRGVTQEPRPHVFALTPEAELVVKTAIYPGRPGLCPGKVKVPLQERMLGGNDWAEVLALRLIHIEEGQIVQFMEDMDKLADLFATEATSTERR